jgi:hypothetical protein
MDSSSTNLTQQQDHSHTNQDSSPAPVHDRCPSPDAAQLAYLRGTEATCKICNRKGHRTKLCIAHLIPNLIIHIAVRKKKRLQIILEALAKINNISITIVDTTKLPELLFIRTQQYIDFLHLIYNSIVIQRHIYSIFVVHDTVRNIQKLCELNFADKTIRIQTYPKNVLKQLIEILPENVQLIPKNYSHVFYVVHAYGR